MMQRLCTFFAVATLLVLAQPGPARAAATGTSHAAACGAWQIVPSPGLAVSTGSFSNVAVVSDTDVWTLTPGLSSVLHHWNGASWTSYPALSKNNLAALAAVAANDVWAFGGTPQGYTYAQHWDGASWKPSAILPTGSDGDGYFTLTAATATSSNNVWAAGYGNNDYGKFTQIVDHWNGQKWSALKTPNVNFVPRSVAADALNNVWVGGDKPMSPPHRDVAVIEHWNNSFWKTYYPSLLPATITSMSTAGGSLWAAGYNTSPANHPSAVVFQFKSQTDKWVNAGAGVGGSAYSAIVANGPADVWAAGYYFHPDRHTSALLQHWNGSSWSMSPVPNLGIGDNFQSIGRSPDGDIMAVGYFNDASDGSVPLATMWSGSSWTRIGAPPTSTSEQTLAAVSADPATDAWAVGYYQASHGQRPMVDHWNGQHWTPQALPVPKGLTVYATPDSGGAYSFQTIAMTGVTALAPNNVWVSGSWQDPTARFYEPLIEHWNGSAWTIVKTPSGYDLHTEKGQYSAETRAVSAISANNIWAVGKFSNSTYDGSYALHWDGSSWSAGSQPQFSTEHGATLNAVGTLAADKVWAVGSYDNAAFTGRSIAFDWTGSKWHKAALPDATPKMPDMTDTITVISASNVWTGGNRMKQFDGHSWSNIPDAITPQGVVTGLAAAGPNDMWAVGNAGGLAVEHWNGHQWTAGVPGEPSSHANDVQFRGTAESGGTFWAVGSVFGKPFVERYTNCP